MNIRKQSEEKIEWVDNTSKYKNQGVTVTLEIDDTIDKISDTSYSALFIIFLKLTIVNDNSKTVFQGITKGVYKVILNKDTTLEQFTFVYSRPYAYLKSQFDNYKIDKPISTIEVPELRENHEAILNAFQTKLPDILN